MSSNKTYREQHLRQRINQICVSLNGMRHEIDGLSAEARFKSAKDIKAAISQAFEILHPESKLYH